MTTITAEALKKHAMEADESWDRHQTVAAASATADDDEYRPSTSHRRRQLKKKHHHKKHEGQANEDEEVAKQIEEERENEFWEQYHEEEESMAQSIRKHQKKHIELLKQVYADPGIDDINTVHGIMIDAGSTGSRLHIYEYQPRLLRNENDIQLAVSGNKLSFPNSESRWTDRLRPGLATFGSIEDDEKLQQAVADYLSPLLEFAKTVLHEKSDNFGQFPIFLRATAGMRILNPTDRARVMNAVRNLFHNDNDSYCPFAFHNEEQARVLSGEEEAVFDWTGVNFLLGDLLSQSSGSGTVVKPKWTHGALDLGGASTQIGFYEHNEDIMANLFKLQIGQAKHWNIYAHSFLFYGMNEAIDRFYAGLARNHTRQERIVDGIYNPCLPGSYSKDVRTNIHFNERNVETWDYQPGLYPSNNGYFQATLVNAHDQGQADECLDAVETLLHLDKNDWCEFAHKGECSFGGVYQPKLPRQHPHEDSFGEFVAFSNYYHVFRFLDLPERASVTELETATRRICSMSHDELVRFNDVKHKSQGKVDDEELDSFCFRSAYALKLLHKGYGFGQNDTIRAVRVIGGQKVGWALGAMLYEINTMPWTYVKAGQQTNNDDDNTLIPMISGDNDHIRLTWDAALVLLISFGAVVAFLLVFVCRERNLRRTMYEPIKDIASV